MFKLIIGPMYAGKTSMAILEAKHIGYGQSVGYFIHGMDTRYGENDELTTHTNFTEDAIRISDPEELLLYKDTYKVFCIDELHFYGPVSGKTIEEVIIILIEEDKIVIGTMLNGDYRRMIFTNGGNLYAIATDIIYLKAKCYMCREDAPYSKMITPDTEEVLQSAGSDVFVAVCLDHYRHN